MSEPHDPARGKAQRPVVSERSESNQSNGSPYRLNRRGNFESPTPHAARHTPDVPVALQRQAMTRLTP